MSSRLHQDKSLEEIRPIIDSFVSNYMKSFGKMPDMDNLEQKLNELQKNKEEQMFLELFGTMTPKNLNDCKDLVKERAKHNNKIKTVISRK